MSKVKGFVPPEITKEEVRELIENDEDFQKALGIKEPDNYKKENSDCKLISDYLPKLIKKFGNKGANELNSKYLEFALSLSVIIDISEEIDLHKKYSNLFSDELTFDFLSKIMDDYELAITDYDDDYHMTYNFLDYVSDSLSEQEK